jgi:nucleoside-diphosphate-sugar epimerase
MADAAPTKGEEAAAVEDEQPRSTAPLYLITGASGFLGYHLVRQLVEDGASVKIFDLNPPGSSRETRSPVGPRASLVSFPLAAARARCRGRASSCNADSSC